MTRLFPCRWFLWLTVVLLHLATDALAGEPETFLDPEDAFIPVVSVDGEQLQVNWRIESGCFLYRHGFEIKSRVNGGEFVRLDAVIPKGEKKYDPFFERQVETYHNATRLTSSIAPITDRSFELVLTSQGCADQGLCFPPTSYNFKVDKHSAVTAIKDVSILGSATAFAEPQEVNVTRSNSNALHNVWLTLLGALLGGLILNLMPCVFPVLSLKALSFAGGHTSKSTLRRHGWSYTLGVVLSFLAAATFILIARSAGQSLGWGFQLQHPVFITFMVYLFFVMGLSLAGAFEFGGAFMGLGQELTSGNTVKSSFFTGVLAALVASPCTAPFMATALGVALTQSVPVSLLIFATLGFGMALPFLALSYSPTLAQWLPRPGAWMEKFKQALSFPMYLTVIWLLWVLSHQTSSETVILALLGLLLIVLALWISGFSPNHRGLKHATNILALTVFLPAIWIATETASSPNAKGNNSHERYTAAMLKDYRIQGKPVFVDLTADWCLTCKVNEKIALTPDIKAQLKSQGIALLVGDWTNKNPEITALLAQHNRSGIPLYLMYPVGGGEPELLPQLLTESIIKNAITRALL